MRSRSPCGPESGVRCSLSTALIRLRQAAKALATGFLFAAQVLGLISPAVVSQVNAAFVGVGMGIHSGAVLAITTLVGIGTVLAVYFVCDAFAMRSGRVGALLKRTEEKTRYGAATLLGLPAVPYSSHPGSCIRLPGDRRGIRLPADEYTLRRECTREQHETGVPARHHPGS